MLYRRRKHIKTNGAFFETLLCLVSFILTLALSDIFSAGLKVKIIAGIATAVYFVLFLLSVRGANYSVEAFYKDICSVAENKHDFSLMLLKDTSGMFPANYLLNYEKRWKCWLFPFVRTSLENDAENVSGYIRDFLGIKDFEIKKISEEDFTKYSVSANLTKTYHHTFYLVTFSAKDTLAQKRIVKINGERFQWFTIAGMKADKRIEQFNGDNVTYVEKLLGY